VVGSGVLGVFAFLSWQYRVRDRLPSLVRRIVARRASSVRIARGELDRFVDAMLAIREEIAAVERGEWPVEDSPLRHAPHPADDVLDDWSRPYPRRQGVHPGLPAGAKELGDKYWPPVSRIDQAYGDRNLMCACPPVEAYLDDLDAEPVGS